MARLRQRNDIDVIPTTYMLTARSSSMCKPAVPPPGRSFDQCYFAPREQLTACILGQALWRESDHAVDRWAEHVQDAWFRPAFLPSVCTFQPQHLRASSCYNRSKHSLLCIGTERHEQTGYDQVSYIFYILSVVTNHADASTSCFLLHASHTPNAMLL